MNNILLVLTGGTIASCNNNGVIGISDNTCRIQQIYEKKYNDCIFDTISPINILSENLICSHWEKIINCILSLDMSKYNGIIITHGSDTLSYSSALIAMCLNSLKIPVVITASNYVPDDPKSNALDNFRASVALIKKMKKGVYTVFKNEGDDLVSVFIPTRLNEADRFNDRFTASANSPSFSAQPLFYIGNDEFIIPDNGLNTELFQMHEPVLELSEVRFDKSVMMIHPYPSINYDDLVLNKNTGAVLHLTYHSGTASENALILLKKCKERNIPMYLCSLKKRSGSLYDSSNKLIKNGALPLFDINTETAYAKLLIGVNLFSDKLSDFMDKDIYFEFC